MTPALEIAACTDCGRVRNNNEDCIATQREIGLVVLADGMGGHNAGEVASDMAVRSTVESLLRDFAAIDELDDTSAESLLVSAIERANERVFSEACSHTRYRGMGTTIVAALWHRARVSIAHVGDSRAYCVRAGKLGLLTRDHTVVQARVERGLITLEQARTAPDRNVLTRAVGTEAAVVVDVTTHDVLAQDAYLLCSDGMHDMLSDCAIEEILADVHAPASSAARALVRQANAAGGLDNVSVIVARVLSLPHEKGA
jgi:PPM family protein phosphatase